ncbi:MAG TPA: Nif3-like dinuclear metal center hexameric protein, partial [Terrimesophilobacter sp.]|nr:Nif3-like dinuclear metal center hexameric protein [Terrimesophilobacter sp.]
MAKPPTTLADVLAVAEELWPLSGASEWDAPGLVTGDPAAVVSMIRRSVDAVAATVDEAIEAGTDLLIAHHPLLLRGVTTVAEDRYKGAMIARLIRAGCALVSAHTNADVVESGTSAVLASRLGLVDAQPIVPGEVPTRGLGRVGRLERPVTLGRLASMLAELLPATASGVRVAGDFEQPVRSVALCGGAGDSLLSEHAVLGAD